LSHLLEGYLLDTNIISELIRPEPNPQVLQWLAEQKETSLFLSVLTLTEIRQGVNRLPQGQRRTQLTRWLEIDLRQRFSGRILPVDVIVADQCGQLRAHRLDVGHPLALADGLIVATTMVHHLTLVTRNMDDFKYLDVLLVNPWDERK
jgi:predicted nucleic acid-binding protein